eukprot:CAMPEP_0183526958 /NCGR_PEP_ID=MMETSP0371-20130417/21693_1 /TAXON_ID=268820 /ORGANISM="Peridinium aciculiferum, Strain PAER-2" /LENGTH=104 /DNA_ID=CAMNT_0025726377 /DNA_START=393 /DNA_END=703 /DNA_ORIENTATION=-
MANVQKINADTAKSLAKRFALDKKLERSSEGTESFEVLARQHTLCEEERKRCEKQLQDQAAHEGPAPTMLLERADWESSLANLGNDDDQRHEGQREVAPMSLEA